MNYPQSLDAEIMRVIENARQPLSRYEISVALTKAGVSYGLATLKRRFQLLEYRNLIQAVSPNPKRYKLCKARRSA